ncbi:MAG: Rne/Rng family ribonuclease [Magnetococcus sp. XQGC-1]
MTKRMLVDATHAEEVRVAVVQDQRLIDLDIETASREQIKGNVYLARVTRVEPSLQAAFVEFHNGRQGFLSINDIHPKYYPPEDPERESKNSPPETGKPAQEGSGPDPVGAQGKEIVPTEDDDLSDELPPSDELRTRTRRRFLPIQRILNRGQTLLVQVVKEARSNKGASLTTHISLAGRYTVLLPENSGGGGISRKITDPVERKHLKEVLNSMEIPGHVSLIIRTAGLGRTKREIARDMSYLLRLWKMIDDKTKQLKPPALIHEEGDLIIRAIRDLYTTDMEEILIDGQEGYRIGKDFMRLLMPRYVKVVQPYKDSLPLFARYQIENQIESMHERKVPLRAGGYLMIDPTEALVTIDINSGRSTRERDVESTAFKTNLQAAEEIGRQLRLRDLGGLVVIDFIDMDDRKHILEVEKQLKDAFKMDRAKIQIGKISSFGLLELSRQRMKPTFNETSRLECPRCKGLGTIRSIESASIHLLRQLMEEVAKGRYSRLTYTTSQDMANYLLNNKRDQLRTLETVHDTIILIFGDPSLQTPEFHKNRVERTQEEMDAREAMLSKVVPVTGEPEEPDYLDEMDDLDEEGDEEGDEEPLTRKAPKAPAREAKEAGAARATPAQPPRAGGTGEAETTEKSRRRRRRRKKSAASLPSLPGMEGMETGSTATEAGPASPDASAPDAVPGRRRAPHPRADTPPAQPAIDGTMAVAHVPGLYVLGSPPQADVATGEEAEIEEESAPDEGSAEGGSPAPQPASRSKRRRRRRRSGQSRVPQEMGTTPQQEETAALPADAPPPSPVPAMEADAPQPPATELPVTRPSEERSAQPEERSADPEERAVQPEENSAEPEEKSPEPAAKPRKRAAPRKRTASKPEGVETVTEAAVPEPAPAPESAPEPEVVAPKVRRTRSVRSQTVTEEPPAEKKPRAPRKRVVKEVAAVDEEAKDSAS